MKFAEVILPLPLNGTFTYLLPDAVQTVGVGHRVIVQFGKNKLYTGIISSLNDDAPSGDYQIKEAIEVIDRQPVVTAQQLRLWRWLSDYYMCPIGEVCKAALPSGMKMQSETELTPNSDFADWDKLTRREVTVLETMIEGKHKSVAQLQKALGSNAVMSTLKSLMEKGALSIKEQLQPSFSPKCEAHVRLAKEYLSEEALDRLARQLEKTPKRYKLLMTYVELSGLSSALTLRNMKLMQEVSRQQLLAESGVTAAVLAGLKAKGIIETYDFEIGRLKSKGISIGEQLPLTDAQQQAFDQIQQAFVTQDKRVCLLHGVTSSGKTEIYIRLIRQQLQAGRQVLYLLPEIALTTQITERLARVFGDSMGVYHSKLSDSERVEMWQKQCSAKPFGLILGVRSALLLPHQNLGLVIVDEEHETSYKQQDPAPRYHARDAAIVLAAQTSAKTLLGTATPSLESYYNAQTGKYGYATLTKRYGDMQMPRIVVADMLDLQRRRLVNWPFSHTLEDEIRKALGEGSQVILFQNRRGHTPVIECSNCGWVPKCRSCDVALTYHQAVNRMVCHYCGKTYPIPTECPQCHEKGLRSIGFGTEKIEEEVGKRFPTARIARLDLDTTHSRNAYERIINSFSAGATDILIGTQMITKGLDFKRVQVVGILDADTMLTRPDFRATERSFQMLSQVAGRAGRHQGRGLVVMQTRHADYPVVQQVADGDYEAMCRLELEERQAFGFPPFTRLIYIYLRYREEAVVDSAAITLASMLRQQLGDSIAGPDRPSISRVQSLYYRKIMVRVAHDASPTAVRAIIRACVTRILADPRQRSVQIYYDVDPM